MYGYYIRGMNEPKTYLKWMDAFKAMQADSLSKGLTTQVDAETSTVRLWKGTQNVGVMGPVRRVPPLAPIELKHAS